MILLSFDPVGAFVYGVIAGATAGIIFWIWVAIDLLKTHIKNKKNQKK